MKSQTADDRKLRNSDPHTFALIDACAIEIGAQKTLFWIVVAPVTAIVIPTVLLALSLYMLAHLPGDLSAGLAYLGRFAESQWFILLFACAIGCLVAGGKNFISYINSSIAHPERRLRPLSGQAGNALSDIVKQLWRTLPTGTREPPHLRWFVNFNVLASAVEGKELKEIQVSSGLWERAVRQDPVAIGILVHEMAHLVFRDGPGLRRIEGVIVSARLLLRSATLAILVTALGAAVVVAISGSYSVASILWRESAVVVFTFLVLLIPYLADLTVRRAAALITALIEVRADACGGLWTGGLDSFSRSLSSDSTVKATSLTDIRHSLLSANLTHLSNSERITLLSDTERLATPKLRYFALSLALPFLLPLNPFTPLLAGGAFDHMLVVAVVVTAHITAVAMAIPAGFAMRSPLSWQASFAVALFLSVATILPQINLYEVGYLLTHLGTGLVSPGGFGKDPFSWGSIASDVATTYNGLQEKVSTASNGGWFILAVVCSAVSLRALSVLSRELHPGFRRFRLWLAPAIAAGIAAVVVTHDEWRSFSFFPFDLAASLNTIVSSVPWMRLCAPELLGLTVFAAEIMILSPVIIRSAKES